MDNVFTVTQVNEQIKDMFDEHPFFGQIFVSGEISNYKLHSSGHHYFTLKDSDSAISAVMFKYDALKLRIKLQNGMKIIAIGRVSSFVKTGQYQLYIKDIVNDGIGALHIAFDKLKQKLYSEGLFDNKYKKELIRFPKAVALITSDTGAAINDMIRIISTRYPVCDILIYPTAVQGKGAELEIVKAIEKANKDKLADTIICGRGGGSIEDLWAFNEEVLARAIFASTIPVISAVGHEPDVTIADLVADVRASTPSNAAEIAVPEIGSVISFLNAAQSNLEYSLMASIVKKKDRLKYLEQKIVKSESYIQDKKLMIDYLNQKLDTLILNKLNVSKQKYIEKAAYLDAISPLKVLSRGFSITTHENGEIVKDANQIHVDDTLNVKLLNGGFKAIVSEIEE